MDLYRLGTNAGGLGARYDVTVVAFTFALLGSNGAVWLEMLMTWSNPCHGAADRSTFCC